jgi:hypothetical protein
VNNNIAPFIGYTNQSSNPEILEDNFSFVTKYPPDVNNNPSYAIYGNSTNKGINISTSVNYPEKMKQFINETKLLYGNFNTNNKSINCLNDNNNVYIPKDLTTPLTYIGKNGFSVCANNSGSAMTMTNNYETVCLYPGRIKLTEYY